MVSPRSNYLIDSYIKLIPFSHVITSCNFFWTHDYSLNKLGSYDYGSHEISIGYYLQTAKSRRPKCYF